MVERVTSSPANWLGRPELGEINVGGKANLTLFRLKDQPITLTDSEGQSRMANQTIEAIGVISGDRFITCEVRPETGY
ncbi:dihydroorotase [compost metagenome]